MNAGVLLGRIVLVGVKDGVGVASLPGVTLLLGFALPAGKSDDGSSAHRPGPKVPLLYSSRLFANVMAVCWSVPLIELPIGCELSHSAAAFIVSFTLWASAPFSEFR